MNTFLILSAIVAITIAKPLDQHVAVTQDTLGNYNLKYAIDGISRAEERNLRGDVSGGFSYVDPHGVLRKLEFVADEHGFHPISGDLPQPVQDTPEVAQAKAEHLALLRAAHLGQPTPVIPEVSLVRSGTVELPLKTEVLEVPQIPLVRSFNSEVVSASATAPVATIPEISVLRTATPIEVVGQPIVTYEIPSHSKVLITKASH